MSIRSRRGHRLGTSLVEIVIAMFILTIVALGTTAYIHHAVGRINRERNRRVAVAVANARLEALRAAPYADVTPPSLNYTTYFLAAQAGGGWNKYDANPAENVLINGRSFRIITRVRYMDLDGGSSSYDCVRAIVTVRYLPGSTDQILLATYLSR